MLKVVYVIAGAALIDPELNVNGSPAFEAGDIDRFWVRVEAVEPWLDDVVWGAAEHFGQVGKVE